jgi:hypothetical protein
MRKFVFALGLSIVLLGAASSAQALPVELDTWTAESYPAVSGFPAGIWTVSGNKASVVQSQNGQPTMFYSDFNAYNTDVTGKITVSGTDDDYIGFAIGFNPSDSTNASADYLLIDWKSVNQYWNFGSPSDTPGSTAYAGLAVSHVFGIPTADEFWGHVNFDSDASGLTELARGTNLGSTGWTQGTEYAFRFLFTPTVLQVYVDDALELNVAGSFGDGRLAFYNFSQAGVTYSAFEKDIIPPTNPTVPEPATMVLLGTGLLGGAFLRRKKI